LKLCGHPGGPRVAQVSPGLTAGGGLKPLLGIRGPVGHWVSPGLTAGGGLKQGLVNLAECWIEVSPGLTAGGGLKPLQVMSDRESTQFPPASPPGAD